MRSTTYIALIAIMITMLSTSVLAGDDEVVIDPSNVDDIIGGPTHVFMKAYADWCGHCKSLIPVWDQLETAFKDEASVTIAKVNADQHKSIGQKYEVSGFPTLLWFPKGSSTPEVYSSDRTIDGLLSFINDKAGTRIRLKKPSSDVVVLNDSNFKSIAMAEEKDVIVEFYAPWCGHCKRLEPIWEVVATSFKRESNVVVAKVDATQEGTLASDYGVTGYPTIKFFPHGRDKTAENYDGGRTDIELISYLNERAGVFRVVGGDLGPDSGLIEEFSVIVEEFTSASGNSDREAVLKRFDTLISDNYSEDKVAKYYSSVMKKIIAKGADFVNAELDRLSRMLTSEKVALNKRDEFVVRRNVLRLFASSEHDEL